jgi:hypothetical protein
VNRRKCICLPQVVKRKNLLFLVKTAFGVSKI